MKMKKNYSIEAMPARAKPLHWIGGFTSHHSFKKIYKNKQVDS